MSLEIREKGLKAEDEISQETLSPRSVPGAPDSRELTPEQEKNIPLSGEFYGHVAQFGCVRGCIKWGHSRSAGFQVRDELEADDVWS